MKNANCPAFHTLWTKPTTCTGKHFEMNNAEMLTMLVSALMWQKHNGTIKLYTDKQGLDFVTKHGLTDAWNGGVDVITLETNDYPIDSTIFWAAGKLMALETTGIPCVMLDTDLIVARQILCDLASSVITALHSETLEQTVYLPAQLLKTPPGYVFDNNFNWDVLPSNTALLYIGDCKFRDYYLRESKKFMFHNMEKPAEQVSQMVFAEQRLLSICAERSELPVNYLLDNPFSLANQQVLHLWGFKRLLRQNALIEQFYIKQLVKTFAAELEVFPLFRKKLSEVMTVQQMTIEQQVHFLNI